MTRRSETLRAISTAATVLEQSPKGARTSFDVIGAVAARCVPLLFRPLDKLWGAFITVNNEARGIIVTTKLGLPVQRFTVAHELGHLLLGHQSSLDETIGFAGRNGPPSRPVQEAAADTFASELLAPKRLLIASAKRHRWTTAKLHRPDHIYQLSLRLGISYQAACWALVTSGVLTHAEADGLQAAPVKPLKQVLAPAMSIENPWADGPSPRPTAVRSWKPDRTTSSRCTFRTTPPLATFGASLMATPKSTSSGNEPRMSITGTVRGPPGYCMSGFVLPACITSSLNTSGGGAVPRWLTSKSTSMGTERSGSVGRDALDSTCWGMQRELRDPSGLSTSPRTGPRPGQPADVPRARIDDGPRTRT